MYSPSGAAPAWWVTAWGKLIATTGSLANTVGANQPFRYRGYVYDEETGWYYLQSRYYDPTTCRFISADVLLSTGQGVIGHNSFAYCGNNSAGRIDSEGTFWEEIGEFFQQLGEAFQNTMNALAPRQQWCTEMGLIIT
ncbi:MAG: RHS repeat-associated core domain-containing protein [Clostridia bacterium]|nr:RHS repeat-associated core domain-containing protein [Clostridia bacterium]